MWCGKFIIYADCRTCYCRHRIIWSSQWRFYNSSCKFPSTTPAWYVTSCFFFTLSWLTGAALTGILMGITQLGSLSGPLIGGALTQHASWRWCKFSTYPIILWSNKAQASTLISPVQPRYIQPYSSSTSQTAAPQPTNPNPSPPPYAISTYPASSYSQEQ